MSNQRVVHAACPHDCPDTCAMLVEVTDGRATRVSGDDAHPTTGGFLCTKVTRYLERVYHPDRLVVLWGTNTLTSNIHLWPEIKEALARGARLIGIDPYRNQTLDHCHQFIQVRPGTDAALALAVMHVIIGEGLCDYDYIE